MSFATSLEVANEQKLRRGAAGLGFHPTLLEAHTTLTAPRPQPGLTTAPTLQHTMTVLLSVKRSHRVDMQWTSSGRSGLAKAYFGGYYHERGYSGLHRFFPPLT
jgi:hypothetical protein